MDTIDRLFPNPAHAALVRKVVEADGTRNAALFASLFTPEGTFGIGGGAPMQGPAAIEAGVTGFFSMLGGGIEHRFHGAWSDKGSLVWQAEVTWTLGDGRRITAPYVNVLRFADDGRVVDYRVHVDMTVLAPPPEPGVKIATSGPIQPVFVVFEVEPERQQEVIDTIRQLHEDVIMNEPGFVSTNLHASLDGRRLINYGQWATKEAYERFLNESLKRNAPPLFATFPPDSRPYRLALQVIGKG